jgi:hypothetical protein
MGHSKKTNILSETSEWCQVTSPCGIKRNCKNGPQADVWLRMHSKGCEICANSNRKVRINHHPLEIIDLENKQNKLV